MIMLSAIRGEVVSVRIKKTIACASHSLFFPSLFLSAYILKRTYTHTHTHQMKVVRLQQEVGRGRKVVRSSNQI